MPVRLVFLPVCSALLLTAAGASGAPATFTDDFSSTRPEWRFHVKGKGVAAAQEGVLRLDLSSPTADKQACADLHLGIGLPFVLEWDQKLERDSPHSYWNGVALWRGGDEGPRLMAGLGGAAAQSRWQITGGHGAAIRPGVWYSFRLEVRADGQTLAVREQETGKAAGEKVSSSRKLPDGLYYLSFYQNVDRLSSPDGDTYAQDRGISLVDNLRLTAASLKPGPPPGPITRPAVVFNRKMRWLDRRDGLSSGILAYDAAADLRLTGTDGASTWLADDPAKVEDVDAATLRLSPGEGKPRRAALRCFQFHLDGHPTLEVDLRPRNASCSLRVAITDPYRAYQRVLATAGPFTADGKQRIDLRKLYRERGYDQSYAELDFVLEVSPVDGGAPSEVLASLRLLPEACVVARSPVVLGKPQADEGVPIEAVCVDAKGELLHGDQVRLIATLGSREVPLTEKGRSGIFAGTAKGLPAGIHTGSIAARASTGPAPTPSPLRVRVHDGRFLDRYSPELRSYCLSDGTAVGPLLGDLYAWNPFVDIGKPGQRMVRGVEEYREHAEKPGKPLELCKYRPLTRGDIAAYMEYLGRCGVRAIRLAPNVSVHEEYLDAGGKLAPRGLEQLSIILEEASRHGIYAVINVFHYPYASPGTGRYPPVQAYLDAGYRGPKDFTHEKTLPMLHGYLGQLLSALREESAVLGYSLTGENDQSYGPEWINALYRFVKENAPHHLVTQEQGGAIQHIGGRDPLDYAAFEPTRSAGLGYRTYYTAGHRSDCYFLVNARLYDRAAPAFLAEVASGPGWYSGAGATWTHPDFITKVRDNFWTALLLRQPMAFSWSACLSEDERRIPTEIARAIDWNAFRRKRPPVAVRAEKPDNEQLARLVRYEAELAALPLDYDILWGDAPAEGYAALFDARGDFVGPEWGKTLPEAVREAQSLRLATGSSATILEGEDGTFAAYVRNTQEYRTGPGYGHGAVELHRQRQKPRPVRLTVRHRPEGCRYRIWNLDQKRIVKEGTCAREMEWDLGETPHDFALLVLPPEKSRK